MEMSRRAKVALGLVTDLAGRSGKRPLVLASAANRLGTSTSHLESIAHRLRARGLIEASRGPGGGYRLAKPATDISVLEVILAADCATKVYEHLLQQRLQGAEADELTQTLYDAIARETASYLRQVPLSSLLQSSAVSVPSVRHDIAPVSQSPQWFQGSEELSTEAVV